MTSSFKERQDDEGNTLYDDGYPVYDFYAKLFYLDGRSESSEEQIKNDLLTYVRRIKDDDNIGDSEAYIIEEAIDQGNINVYYQTPIQEFVGQGILDVGEAVSGPGALNARRLEKENISDKYLTDGQKTAMYEIDTKGYDSVWSNDIKEIRVGKLADNNTEEDLKERYNYYNLNWISNNKADKWAKILTKAYVEEFNDRVDKSGLEGLHVGLLKSGKGILKLEGNNTYKGATVVTDGAIAVNGSVAGDVYSENEGIIMGKGKINGILYNNNIAVAGDNGEGNLSMGALESKGQLISSLNNGENSKFIVDGNAKIDGSTVVVAGLMPGESCTVLKADSITGELANSQENSSIRPSTRAATTPQQMAQILTFINLPAQQAGPALSAVVNNAAAQSMTLVQRNSVTGDILSSHFGDRFTIERKADALLPLRLASHPGARMHSQHPVGRQSLRDSSPINGGASGKKEDAAPLCGEAGERSETEGGALQSNAFNERAAERSEAEGAALQSNAVDGAAHEVSGAWFKFVYNKGEMRDGARYRGRSGLIGYDLKLTDTKSFGLFFGHGNNTLDGFDDVWAKNKIEENKFGFYTSRKIKGTNLITRKKSPCPQGRQGDFFYL